MSELTNKSQHYSVDIECWKCRQKGRLDWEKSGSELFLLDISKGFYEQVSKKAHPIKLELVCENCGMIQPTQIGAR